MTPNFEFKEFIVNGRKAVMITPISLIKVASASPLTPEETIDRARYDLAIVNAQERTMIRNVPYVVLLNLAEAGYRVIVRAFDGTIQHTIEARV